MKDLLVCCLYDQPATWKELTAKNSKQCNPGPLRNHTLSSYKSNLILIGGQQNVVENNPKIYRFDLLANTWSVCRCVDEKGKPFKLSLDSHSTISHSTFSSTQKAISTSLVVTMLTKQPIRNESSRYLSKN
jgi:hypothetical protein